MLSAPSVTGQTVIDTGYRGKEPATSVSGEHRLLSYRVERLEEAHKEAVGEIRDAVQGIDRSLQSLAVIQEQHATTRQSLLHATKLLQALSEKVNRVELELPTLKLARKLVLTTMTLMGGAIGVAVLALVMKGAA